ncbi:MAG: hypothetical protein ACRCSN_21785 [Dermatophilaceae bacterium]
MSRSSRGDNQGDTCPPAGVLEVQPLEMCRMAAVALEVSGSVWTNWGVAEPRLALESGSAGSTPAAASLVAGHQDVVDAAGAALGVLAQVLERDVDSLYLSAFAYSDADEEAARGCAAAVKDVEARP